MKVETLEEAAKNYNLNTINAFGDYESFIAGAKWQQERSYSEEEVFALLNDLRLYSYNYGMSKIELLEWFKKFKKK
jgi:hypothetical protein